MKVNKLYSNLNKYLSGQPNSPTSQARNFFDLPVKERAQIVKAAGRDAQKQQESLLNKFALLYSKN